MDRNLFIIFVVVTVVVLSLGIVFFAKNKVFKPLPPMQLRIEVPSPVETPAETLGQ